MAKNKNDEAPKVLNVSIWSLAIVGALAFSISIGGLVSGWMGLPEISADKSGSETTAKTTSVSCQTGETPVMITNYPGGDVNKIGLDLGGKEEDAKTGQDGTLHHTISSLVKGNRWYCQVVCVPWIDQTKTMADGKNQSAIRDYFGPATISGESLKLIGNADDLETALKSAQSDKKDIGYYIYLPALQIYKASDSSTKCQGPSDPYPSMTTKVTGDEEIKVEPKQSAGDWDDFITKAKEEENAAPKTNAPAVIGMATDPGKPTAPSYSDGQVNKTKSGSGTPVKKAEDSTKKSDSGPSSDTAKVTPAKTDKKLIPLIKDFNKCKKDLVTANIKSSGSIVRSPANIIARYLSDADRKEYKNILGFYALASNMNSKKMAEMVKRCQALLSKASQSPEHLSTNINPDGYVAPDYTPPPPPPTKEMLLGERALRLINVHQAEGYRIYQKRHGSTVSEAASMGNVCVAITDVKHNSVKVSTSKITKGGNYNNISLLVGNDNKTDINERVILFAYDFSGSRVRYYLSAPTLSELSKLKFVTTDTTNPGTINLDIAFSPMLLPYITDNQMFYTGKKPSTGWYGPYGELTDFITKICQKKANDSEGATYTFTLKEAYLDFLAK